MNKKISIVVPIYNVENYLDKCISSIVNQTYGELEIILVDDGSKDNSSKICDEWKEKDSRIKVIHKENGGLSSARNAGLEVATGEYIMFEDSDDWLVNDIVEKCVARIENDDSDMVIFGYRKVDEEGKDLGNFTFGNDTYSREELSEQLHKRILEMSFGYAWNKLYRLAVIKESQVVNDGTIIDREDLYFNMSLLNHLNRISYLDYEGYCYLQRSNSLLHNGSLARLEGIESFIKKMKSISWGDKEQEEKVFNMVVLHYLSDCFVKNVVHNNQLNKKEKIKAMEKYVKWGNCYHIDNNNPRYLNCLAYAIKKNKLVIFYYYVKMVELKKILKRNK